ncbi:DUF2141 domain-containing protein [Erythrobacter sp. 3-20A1M]|uniref:DUF2141 domain-containing protein n=1 Tax=Erythrobacter sp. 3-20A1M TaxID=2653850 RepID=UPI0035301071
MAGLGLAGNAALPRGDVRVTVTGLRSDHGQVLACLTADAKDFPDCSKDPAARRRAIPAQDGMQFTFSDVPQGEYAIALLHDENANGKADKALMVPKEGFGFSRNAKLRLGPPSFSSAAFAVDGPLVKHTIRMRYIF